MDTSEDAFLGGRLKIRQPKGGYRAGADPVFLAAAVSAEAGQEVLELGCGAGVAMLCLAARLPGVRVTGVEVQPPLADLARDNFDANGLEGSVVVGDVTKLPEDVRARSFDHVMTNPPFFAAGAGSPAKDESRDVGRRADATVAPVWLDHAVRRLRQKGTLTLINRVESLPSCLSVLDGRVGAIRVMPLAPRRGRAAKLFVLSARKDARTPMVLLPPFVLHEGAEHARDEDSYTEQARSVLRDGAALPL